MISPTIGRKVWYWPYGEGANLSVAQPYDATVVYVWGDHCVNLVIRDHHGGQFMKTCVTLAQERRATPGECEWMPFQKGQAAKVEAAEAQPNG